MSLILHLETATTVCSVALSFEGKLISLKEENNGYTHAEHLSLFIEDVLLLAGKKMTDIDAVAISKGPGSYTGLRIGVATAKGICYGLNKPLIAVNTLLSLANIAADKYGDRYLICPMLDARRMEVYTAVFYCPPNRSFFWEMAHINFNHSAITRMQFLIHPLSQVPRV
jgi:tRNA threonylcarbamoyladenosine biosynthesis protein TsaB